MDGLRVFSFLLRTSEVLQGLENRTIEHDLNACSFWLGLDSDLAAWARCRLGTAGEESVGRGRGWVGDSWDRLRKQGTAAAVAVALWQRTQLGPALKTELTRMYEGKEKENSPGRRQKVYGLSTSGSGVSCVWGKELRKAPIWWRSVGTSWEPEGRWLHLQVHLAERLSGMLAFMLHMEPGASPSRKGEKLRFL